MPTPSASTSISERSHRRFVWPAGAILVAAVAVAFGWPTRGGGVIAGDDERLALHHAYVNHPSWANAARLLTIVHGDLYQPLPVLSFQLNYALAESTPAGRSPVSLYGFHLTNILLHAACCVLVFFVASRLSRCRRIGLFTALLFACHPFAVEPVAWISGRIILLASLFSLLLFLILPLRQRVSSGVTDIASVVTWLFALCSKVLPTVPVAALWCDGRTNGTISRRRWTIYAVLLLLAVAATGLVYHATREAGFIEAMAAEPADPLQIRILLAARHYIENYFWPDRLAGWSPPPFGHSAMSTPVLIAVAELTALVILIVVTWRRRPIICLGLGLFLILIAPFLAASVARRFLAADRYMYLPIVGLHLAVSSVLISLHDEIRRRSGRAAAAVVIGAPAVAIMVAFFVVSWRLGPTWADNVRRSQRSLEVYRDDVLAHVELAKSYVIEKQPDAALAVIEDARKRWPDHPRLAGVAGEAFRMKKDWPAAERELRRAVAGMPQYAWTRYFLARTLDDVGKTTEARDEYRRILEDIPTHYPAAVALARSYENAGEAAEAISAYQKAVAINPYDSDTLLSLAVLYVKQQQWTAAEPLLRSILNLDPDDGPALLNLGVVLARENRLAEAMEIDNRLIVLHPDELTARVNRASLLSSLGRSPEAVDEFRSILAKDPDHRGALIGLHEVLQSQKKYPDLVDLWRQYSGKSIPEDERLAWLGWSLVLAGDSRQAVNNALTLKPGTEARAFANWTMAYLALTRDEVRSIPDILGPPKPHVEQPPSAASFILSVQRLEWLHVVSMGFDSLPADKRNSPAGLYILARLSLENGNVSVAEQAARHVMQETANEQLKNAADAVLKVIAESHKRARQQ